MENRHDPNRLHVRIADEERAMVEAGKSRLMMGTDADYVRWLIRQDHLRESDNSLMLKETYRLVNLLYEETMRAKMVERLKLEVGWPDTEPPAKEIGGAEVV